MIERATGILERELKGGAFIQGSSEMKSAASLSQALSTMVQAAMIGSEDASKLTAFVQSTENADDDQETPTRARAAASSRPSRTSARRPRRSWTSAAARSRRLSARTR